MMISFLHDCCVAMEQSACEEVALERKGAHACDSRFARMLKGASQHPRAAFTFSTKTGRALCCVSFLCLLVLFWDSEREVCVFDIFSFAFSIRWWTWRRERLSKNLQVFC
jgi:hypothetical protein